MHFNFKLFFRLTYHAFFKAGGTDARFTKRIKALLFWYTVMPAYHVLTGIALWLDEIFFPAYRSQKVEEPIFIISNFRSGSTLLHRLMADDDTFTAMTIFEIYVAPAITQRVFYRWLARMDRRWLGGYFMRRLDALDQRVLGSVPMHRMGLRLVDEDEGILIHNWTSIFLIFVFPFLDLMSPYFWFDERVSGKEKHLAMKFYKRCLQRHVYYHGGKRYVAKSPAFSVKMETLREYFPDARFIYLARNPVDMVASKTSYFAFCWHYFNDMFEPYPFRDFMLEFTKHWYLYPLKLLPKYPSSSYLTIKYDDLTSKLGETIKQIYAHFEIEITPQFARSLAAAVERSKKYVSKNRYSLVEMDYTPQQIHENYRAIFNRFGFSLNGKAMEAEALSDALVDVE
jgi:hypothetical protein